MEPVENNQNNTMQTASQTPENGQAEKKTPLTSKRIRLIRLTVLFVTGILLMPTKVTQNEAKTNPSVETYTEDKAYIVRTAVSWTNNERLSKSKKEKLKLHGGITLDKDAQGKPKSTGLIGKTIPPRKFAREIHGTLPINVIRETGLSRIPKQTIWFATKTKWLQKSRTLTQASHGNLKPCLPVQICGCNSMTGMVELLESELWAIGNGYKFKTDTRAL